MRVPTKNYLYEYDVSHKFFYLKLINYLKAHTFVTFHCFVQFFLRRKYSSVSSLTLEYITLLYIVNKLPLCSQYYFETICLQWSFQKKTISSLNYLERPFIEKLTHTYVKRLLKRFKDSSTMNRKEGSGWPRSVTTEENTNLIEELICSK